MGVSRVSEGGQVLYAGGQTCAKSWSISMPNAWDSKHTIDSKGGCSCRHRGLLSHSRLRKACQAARSLLAQALAPRGRAHWLLVVMQTTL